MSAPTDTALAWHHRTWQCLMIKHQGEHLVYRQGDRVGNAERIALRFSGHNHEWTETG
jgi:hypothetical protein